MNIAKNPPPQQQISSAQGAAADQLRLLGYTNADRFYYRAIGQYPQKFEGIGFEIPPAVHQASISGQNLYVVVNGGGHTDADVTAGRAVFYEHDNLDKSAQIGLWQSLGLPEPTFQVDTGGKSIHSYWVFDAPCPIADWKRLQADLLEFADADRSIKNPRAFRTGSVNWGSSQLGGPWESSPDMAR